MTSVPPRPSIADLYHMVRLAKKVLNALPPAAANLPPDAQRALRRFYDLTDYHGVAPDDAPHIPDDGRI